MQVASSVADYNQPLYTALVAGLALLLSQEMAEIVVTASGTLYPLTILCVDVFRAMVTDAIHAAVRAANVAPLVPHMPWIRYSVARLLMSAAHMGMSRNAYGGWAMPLVSALLNGAPTFLACMLTVSIAYKDAAINEKVADIVAACDCVALFSWIILLSILFEKLDTRKPAAPATPVEAAPLDAATATE